MTARSITKIREWRELPEPETVLGNGFLERVSLAALRDRIGPISAIKAGANELEVTAVNLWPNRLIGDDSLPASERFTETNMRKFVSKSQLLPSGLLGPVRVLEQSR